jgi:hypothetical protein
MRNAKLLISPFVHRVLYFAAFFIFQEVMRMLEKYNPVVTVRISNYQKKLSRFLRCLFSRKKEFFPAVLTRNKDPPGTFRTCK